ncbi:MAG: enoyl-CoA hydratase/isomerase family protein [Kordiimonadaceae bacterium]|nr:enoyl-CoA hydratase/isomerase family protein [Kordiimonadaceae bacterium]MBO6569448.1 enoyl-CoA hydratase/isomerase family protein [Kordiimonadaceae bacterium]MBO6964923.1 enoyl-CoA hydratase/isomerase family protein [Kordiimonadaceae bacterium]
MAENATTEAEVLFEKRGNIGLITLNRPKALNSLTHGMCVLVHKALDDWATDDAVQAVVVVGAGDKAFCAGGDVVKVTQSYKAGTTEWRDFFHDEYLMNIAINEFPKPYISLVDGIAMGGGVGVSIPGDFWVSTEKTLFAMPETGLGLFPDVGGGWFLPRLPGETGMFLALTGARIKAPDLYAQGIATHHITSDKIEDVIAALAAAEISGNEDAAAVLDQFHTGPGEPALAPYYGTIDGAFAGVRIDEIMHQLELDESEWAQKQFKTLVKKSPTSLKLTLAQLRRGKVLDSFRDNMRMEFRMVNRVMEGKDFYEGVRAILIDKDNTPVWEPNSLERVERGEIEHYFEPLENELAID